MDFGAFNMKNIAYFFISAIAIVVVLSFGQTLLIPFVFALLLWFAARKIKSFMDRVGFIKNKFPGWAKNLLTSIIIITVFFYASKVISSSINSLARSYRKYEANVDLLIIKVNEALNINLIELLRGHIGTFDFGMILSTVFMSVTDLFGSTFMIILYTLFIFLEETYFQTKLKTVFSENNHYEKVSNILERVERSVAKYLGLKTLLSFITGALSYVVLLLIGIDSPVFWAFLIFLLNFIPTIGSLVATVFPAVFSLLQFGEFMPGLMVLLFVGMVQILVGNILEPKLMGSSMNLSPLMTIIALSFWGAIWGVTGMILSVPITVIMVIIFSQIPSTRPVAIMLSEKGVIE
jgi:predicted PurR-regulated permease PerM